MPATICIRQLRPSKGSAECRPDAAHENHAVLEQRGLRRRTRRRVVLLHGRDARLVTKICLNRSSNLFLRHEFSNFFPSLFGVLFDGLVEYQISIIKINKKIAFESELSYSVW